MVKSFAPWVPNLKPKERERERERKEKERGLGKELDFFCKFAETQKC